MKRELLLLLFSAIIIPVLLSPQTVTAIDLNDEKFKVIVSFELNTNPNVIRGSYQQDVSPQLNDIFDDLGLNTFDKTGQGANNNPNDYSYTVFAMAFQPVGTNPMSDDSIFQIYPLVRITGDKPELTQAEYNLAVDITVAGMRTAIVDFLEAEGATNVKTYIHFSFGGVHIDEGF